MGDFPNLVIDARELSGRNEAGSMYVDMEQDCFSTQYVSKYFGHE